MKLIRMRSISINRIALLAAVGTIVISGCQRDSFVSDYDGILRICPSVDKLSGVSVSTKGELINEGVSKAPFDPTKSFFVRAYDADAGTALITGTVGTYQEVKMKGTQWNTVYTKEGTEYSQEYLWMPNQKKTFYAYANLPANGYATVTNTDHSGQTLTYTVPSSTADQTDILLGYYSGDGTTGGKMTGTAAITFYHPLTAVTFKKGAIPEGCDIASISIAGLYPDGKTTQSSATAEFAWTTTAGAAFTDEYATMEMTFPIDDTALLIPQSFASTSKTRIKVVVSDGVDNVMLYYPLADTNWKAGYHNTYTIDITGEITFYHIVTINQTSYIDGGAI